MLTVRYGAHILKVCQFSADNDGRRYQLLYPFRGVEIESFIGPCKHTQQRSSASKTLFFSLKTLSNTVMYLSCTLCQL